MRKILVRAGIPFLALVIGCVAASPAEPGTPRLLPWDDPIVSPELPLTAPGTGSQRLPSIAFDGTNYLAAWIEDRSFPEEWSEGVYAGRVSATGEPLDGSGFLVANGPGNLLDAPVVAEGIGNSLVAWTGCHHYMEVDYCSLYAARVSRNGNVLDPNPIPMPTGGDAYPVDKAVAFDGTNYLVVWSAGGSGIDATRVSQDGVVLDPQRIPIWTGPGGHVAPAVAFDGTNYLVAWEDYAAGDADVVAVRMRPDGTVLDPYGIPVAPTVGEQKRPQIAFGAGQYLVVWQGGLTDSGGVCARRVTEWGDVLDPAGIPIATSGQWTSPVVAFSNPNYVAIWEDRRNGGVDLYGARIAGDGTVLDPAGFFVSEVGSVWSLPDVVSPWPGRAAVAYNRLDGPSRAFLRFVDEAQPPPPPEPPSAGCLPSEPHPPPPPPPPPPGLLPPPPWPSTPSKCHVPRLVGLRLSTARRRIRARGCRVGRVRRVRASRRWAGRVVAQSPRAGRFVRRGTSMKISLGSRGLRVRR